MSMQGGLHVDRGPVRYMGCPCCAGGACALEGACKYQAPPSTMGVGPYHPGALSRGVQRAGRV